MKHGKKEKKFGRETKQRKELLRGLAEALISRGKITTSQAKAKSLRPYIERIITKSKVNNIATARFLASRFSRALVKKLLQEIRPKFAGRRGGYVRITKLPPRASDSAKMAIIELVESSSSS
jgi:large subunit ribosomal protein L17